MRAVVVVMESNNKKEEEQEEAAVSSSGGIEHQRQHHHENQEKSAKKSQEQSQVNITTIDDWDYGIHSAFVKAIFEEGLKTCSPSVLIGQMHAKTNCITSER